MCVNAITWLIDNNTRIRSFSRKNSCYFPKVCGWWFFISISDVLFFPCSFFAYYILKKYKSIFLNKICSTHFTPPSISYECGEILIYVMLCILKSVSCYSLFKLELQKKNSIKNFLSCFICLDNNSPIKSTYISNWNLQWK